jgi:putative ABC transport system permease protein
VDYRRRASTLSETAAWGDGQVNLTGDGDPERVASGNVSANIFSTLGVAPLLGRTFTATEDLPNGPNLVVLSHSLWSRRYAADPDIAGRTIQINGRGYEVTGVMPPDFVLPTDYQNPSPTQLWLPLQMDPASMDHGSHGFYAAARLKPGATVQQAAEELHGIAGAMTNEGLYPRPMQFDTVVLSLEDEVVGSVRRAIWLLFGAVAFLLLIACANVANLLLARAEGRQREIAVRAALGASGLRVMRQLLTESLVLTGLATVLGLALAFAGVRFVAWWNPASVPRVAGVRLDLTVLFFTALVAVITSIAFSLAPALRALHVDLTESLKDGAQGASSGGARQRFRSGLVVVEMALAVVCWSARASMLRSLWSLQHVPLGFDPSRVLTMRLSLPQSSYGTPEQVVDFFSRLLDDVRAFRVSPAAGAVRALPLASTIGDFGLRIEGYTPTPGTGAKGDWQIATPGYLESIGERVVRGRPIAADDKSDTMLVGPDQRGDGQALLARPRSDRRPLQDWRRRRRPAVGHRRRDCRQRPSQRHHRRGQGEVLRAAHAVAQVDRQSDPRHDPGGESRNPIRARWRVRSGRPSVHSIPTCRSPTSGRWTMWWRQRCRRHVSRACCSECLPGSRSCCRRSASTVCSRMSSVRRTREIGIRVAIGAGRAQVLKLVLASGIGLALLGIGIGLAAAAALSKLTSTLLHDVRPLDPATFASRRRRADRGRDCGQPRSRMARDPGGSGQGVESRIISGLGARGSESGGIRRQRAAWICPLILVTAASLAPSPEPPAPSTVRSHRSWIVLFTPRFFVMCGFTFTVFLSAFQLLPRRRSTSSIWAARPSRPVSSWGS